MLCWLPPYINMNQPSVYICALLLEPPSHLPPHPTPLGCHRAPDLSSVSHTAHFHWSSILHMIFYVSTLLCQLVPPSFPTVSASPFSRSVSPLTDERIKKLWYIYAMKYYSFTFAACPMTALTPVYGEMVTKDQ